MSFFTELKRRNVIRVGMAYLLIAWLLLQAADFGLDLIDAPNWAIQALFLLAAIGLPAVLVFSWVFEMTPEGIRKESEIDRSQSITQQTARKLNHVITTTLVLAVAYLLLDKFVLRPAVEQAPTGLALEMRPGSDAHPVTTARPAATGLVPAPIETGSTSIAVLPFVNMSADADNEYFSDGISEELLNVLVKVSDLHVASRTSAFAYKNKEIPVSEIARQLQVDNVLEGSVRKAGNRVRITAQLIDAKTDRHLWSETYERELDDIFDIQEEISNNIVSALKIVLNVDEAQAVSRAQRPTDNLQAYEHYLQGLHLWRQRGEANMLAAVARFEQAIELDAGFAVAYAALAATHASLGSWSAITRKEALENALPFANRALELDPTLSEARAVRAEYLGEQFNWTEMWSEYQQALLDTPNNPTIRQWHGEILHNLGYLQAALEELLIAYQLDPAAPVINNVLTYVAYPAGRPDLSHKHAEIASELGLTRTAMLNLSPLLLIDGKTDKLISNAGWTPEQVPLCLRAMQDPALKPELKTQLANMTAEELRRLRFPFKMSAQCFSFVDEQQAFVRLVRPRIQQQDWYSIDTFWLPGEAGSKLRQTPEFRQLVVDMGLVDFWRRIGWPDLCRPLGADDFECD